MRIWSALFNILGLVLVLIWMSISVKQSQNCNDFYEAQAMKVKAEYACEAAMYQYTGNKSYWLDTYNNLMCDMYDLGCNKQNYDKIMDSIAAAMYVGDNSIEVLTRNKDKRDFNTEIVAARYDVNDTESLLLNLFSEEVAYINLNTLEEFRAASTTEMKNTLSQKGINIDMDYITAYRPVIIAEIINKALMRSYVGLNDNIDRAAYIPTYDISEFGINSIKDKSLIIIQKDFCNWNKSIITTAGYSVYQREWIVGFIEDGIKYYCREGEAPTDIANQAGNRMFKTVYDAAAEGYIPATQYLR